MKLCTFFLASLLSLLTIEAAVKSPSPISQDPFEHKGILTPQEKESQTNADEPGPDYRLPSNLIPLHYDLQIRPIIDRNHTGVGAKNTAPGHVEITVRCDSDTQQVVLHQKFLIIDEASIQVTSLDDGKVVAISLVGYDAERDFLILNLTEALRSPNSYVISIDYTANVPPNDSLRGLYSEEYFDPLTNQTKIMAATQLEPVRARQVFPCLDEPTYKAPFDLVIGRTENFTSLANAPLINTKPDSDNAGWFWDTFNTTVPMPTYLFAMAVSDYSYNEASNDLYRLPVRVYGPRHLTDEGAAQLAADGSAMLMKHFEARYGIAHKMPKVDSISVPNKRGAMENYGLITYGEYLLMYQEGVTLDTQLRQILSVLAHELGHQWFGNLVTCKWWSDIWLNEGFASYVSYEGVQALWPRFDMMNYMISSTVNTALKYDATANSHPIHDEAYSAEEIGRNMDTIGYDKGGSIIRMMVSFMGEDTFYSGIKQYLNRLQDQVAEQDDLFEDLDQVSSSLNLPKTVTQIMHTWTLQKGFPLVKVSLQGSSLTFSQEPWQNADVRLNESFTAPNSSWDIPVKYKFQNGNEGNLWLLEGNDNIENVTMPTGSDWVLTNPDAGGYYRTQYDDVLAKSLVDQLDKDHTAIPVAAKIRLIDDQMALSFEKYQPIQNCLEFTKYLADETDPNVWATVFSNLQKLRLLWGPYTGGGGGSYDALKMYFLSRVEGARAKVEQIMSRNPEDASAASILYTQLVDWSCFLGSEWCDALASQFTDQWIQNPDKNPVPVNLQSTMYCKMVEIMGESAYNLVFNEHHKPGQTPAHKERLASAMGCAVQFDTNDLMMMAVQRTGFDAADSLAILQRINAFEAAARFRIMLYIQLTDFFFAYGWTQQELFQIASVASNYFWDRNDQSLIGSLLVVEMYDHPQIHSIIADVDANWDFMLENNYNITVWFHANSE